ncbi:MAG: carbonic anhydrase, partial [Saccharothrix sp.]|nr:carbonic anhydrase [Saccharothrix sp.]
MGSVTRPQRRAFLTGGLLASAAVLTGCSSKSDTNSAPKATVAGAASTPSAAAGARPDSPWSAFARRMEGNERWVDGTLQHPVR